MTRSLKNKKVLIVGEFEDLPLPDVEASLAALGASVVEELNRAADLVVAGRGAPNRTLKKAGSYGIPVIEQWQFKALRDGASLTELIELTNHGPRVFEKGATVKVVSGPEAVGMIGQIFWWGNSKFGAGMRAGVDGVDGEKYWIDEEHLGWPDEEVEDPSQPRLGKGVEANVTGGEHQGASGTIFWWGKSKYGEGMRAGLETEGGETLWVDESDLELA